MSSVSKGNKYKSETKKWLEEMGYSVEYSEMYIKKAGFMKKHDIFGADLIAMSRNEIIFVASVFGRTNIARNKHKFNQYPFPSFVKRWIVIWEKKGKEPDVYEL